MDTESYISLTEKEKLIGQTSCVIWFTGLSGSGKSTLARQLEKELYSLKFKTYVLDGDNLRNGLNKDLSFTNEDRIENIRRVGELSSILSDAGLIVISSFISPFEADRLNVRKKIGKGRFFEIFVDCPIDICESRDVKGLYKKARNGEIKQFTGIDSTYERPSNPELTLHTNLDTVEESTKKILTLILNTISIKSV